MEQTRFSNVRNGKRRADESHDAMPPPTLRRSQRQEMESRLYLNARLRQSLESSHVKWRISFDILSK